MNKEELIQRLKRIKHLVYQAHELHDRASLDEANSQINNLLNDFDVDVPYPLPSMWWKE